MQSGPLRNAYLEALGIDRWVARNAPAELLAEPVTPAVRAAPAQAPTSVPVVHVPLEPTGDWGTLRERVAACTACDLCKTRTQTVFGVGDTRAEWLIVIAGCSAPSGRPDERPPACCRRTRADGVPVTVGSWSLT